MTPFAIGGTVLWALAGLVTLIYRDELAAPGRSMWLWTCLAGVIWGTLGIAAMHARAKRRR